METSTFGAATDEWVRARFANLTEGEPCRGGVLYRGFTLKEGWNFFGPAGFEEVEDWCDHPYRMVWKSGELRAVVTYCEGDLGYEVYPDDKTYQASLAAAEVFYSEHG